VKQKTAAMTSLSNDEAKMVPRDGGAGMQGALGAAQSLSKDR
jgi:hypothetical protein